MLHGIYQNKKTVIVMLNKIKIKLLAGKNTTPKKTFQNSKQEKKTKRRTTEKAVYCYTIFCGSLKFYIEIILTTTHHA